jgi:cytochrome c peroxidase
MFPTYRIDIHLIYTSRRLWLVLNERKALVIRIITWTLALLSGSALAETSEPIAPLPFANTDAVVRATLGERLFHDPILSRQGIFSCATCHPLDQGAMDGRSRGMGIEGKQLRNVPTLFNVGFNYYLNWDGSATTLEAHAERLLSNPRVMNNHWPELLARLQAQDEYVRSFAVAYPDGITQANLLDALANFERSLVTPNCRFDRYLRGEHDALDAAEQEGYRLFKSLGCVSCHQGMNIGGNLFQKFGIFGTPDGIQNDTDEGRFIVTHSDRDRGVYRVPSLRNVAVTAPYFHDGRASTLEAAVDTMAKQQLGRQLTANERSLIVRFLQTLTGEYRNKPLSRGTAAPQ